MAEDVTLRPVAEDDLPLINHLSMDGGGQFQWFGWHDPHQYRRRWEDNGLLDDDLAILMVAAGTETLGLVSWHRVPTPRAMYCWNMGIVLAQAFRGHGYGTRAQRLLVEYLFAHTPVNRVEASTEVENVAEQRALERAGFTREGVMRGYGFRDGQWRDGVLYSVLRAEIAG